MSEEPGQERKKSAGVASEADAGSSLPSLPNPSIYGATHTFSPLTLITNGLDVPFEKKPRKNLWNKDRQAQVSCEADATLVHHKRRYGHDK
jgi:hypothetical protein